MNYYYCYFWIWSKKVCLETILHLFKIYKYLQRTLRITRHFKPLINGKIIFWTIQISFKTFRDVCLGFCLVCRFTSLRDFFFWENVYVMSIASITQLFFKTRSFKKAAVRGSSSESQCSWNHGKKKQLLVKFLFNVVRLKKTTIFFFFFFFFFFLWK